MSDKPDDETKAAPTHTIEVVEFVDDSKCSGRPGCKSNRLPQNTGRPWVCAACESGSNSPLAVGVPPIGGGRVY